MKGLVYTLIAAVGAAALCVGAVGAQEQSSAVEKVGRLVPLRIVIVISRYQGEKKVSSLPYTLSVNANDGSAQLNGDFISTIARLRTGANVPVPSMGAPKESPVMAPVAPVQYKSIGTNIDCTARSTDDGRFRVNISIDDTSVYSDGQTAQGAPNMSGVPSFRTFQTSNAVLLKDGQSTEFTAAADRITGEVTKVVVTATVVK